MCLQWWNCSTYPPTSQVSAAYERATNRKRRAVGGLLPDVCPTFSVEYAPGLRMTDTVLFADRTKRHSVFSVIEDGSYLSLGKFDVIIAFSAWRPPICSPLLRHICHIISLCADENVCRVDAGGNVAMMKDGHTDRYLADMKFVGIAMGKMIFAVNADNPVPSGVFCSNPVPAPIRFLYLSPEPFFCSGEFLVSVTKAHRFTLYISLCCTTFFSDIRLSSTPAVTVTFVCIWHCKSLPIEKRPESGATKQFTLNEPRFQPFVHGGRYNCEVCLVVLVRCDKYSLFVEKSQFGRCV